jgi:hypothetical protein
MTSRIVLGQQFAVAVRMRGLTCAHLAEFAGVAPATGSAALCQRTVNMSTALRFCRAVEETPVVPALERWSKGSDAGGCAH